MVRLVLDAGYSGQIVLTITGCGLGLHGWVYMARFKPGLNAGWPSTNKQPRLTLSVYDPTRPVCHLLI